MSFVSIFSSTRPPCVVGPARSPCRCAATSDHTRQVNAAPLRRRSLLIAPLVAYTLHAASGATRRLARWTCIACLSQNSEYTSLSFERQAFFLVETQNCVSSLDLMQAVKHQAWSLYHYLSFRTVPALQARPLKPLSPRQRQQQRLLRSQTSSRA